MSIFSQAHDQKYYKYILVFTDGGTGQQDKILTLIHENKKIAAVYPIGIGDGIDEEFLKKVE